MKRLGSKYFCAIIFVVLGQIVPVSWANPTANNHESLDAYLGEYQTIYDPVFSRQGKLQFDFPLGLTLNHPFKSGIMLPLATLTWHITHRWSWEILDPSFVIPWNTALSNALIENSAQLNFPTVWGSIYSNIAYTPIYGKIRLWKQDSTPLYFSFVLGAGGLFLQDQTQNTLSNFRFNFSAKAAARMTAMFNESFGVHTDFELRSFSGSGLLGNEIYLLSLLKMGLSWVL